MAILSDNPILWANLQIIGGWKRVGLVAGAVTFALPLLIFGSVQMNPARSDDTMQFWTRLLLVVQVILIGLVVPSRVHGAVKRDRTLKLIESHRLMPVKSSHAIIGYLIGPNVMLMTIGAVILVIGAMVTVGSGEDVGGWFLANAVLAVVATLASCLTVFAAHNLPRVNPMFILVPAGMFGGGLGLTLLPAVKLMAYPVFGGMLSTRTGSVEWMHVASAVGQMSLASVLLIGAMRRYRRDDMPALGFALGTLLLLVWVTLTIGGIVVGRGDGFAYPMFDQGSVNQSFIASIAITMLIGMAPVASAAMQSLAWHKRKAIDEYFVQPRPPGIVPGVVLTFLISSLLLSVIPVHLGSARVVGSISNAALFSVMTAGVILIHLSSTAIIAWYSSRRGWSPLGPLIGWVILTWALAPLIEAVAFALQDRAEDLPGPITSSSPIGSLAAIWTGNFDYARTGLIVQTLVLAILVIAARFFTQKKMDIDLSVAEPNPG